MAEDTLARMFWSRIDRSGDRPAQQFKRDGTWQTLTWRQVGEIVREAALGLIALGRRPGDAVGLLSASRVEWVQADAAILSSGCITIPIYPSYPPELVAYIVNEQAGSDDDFNEFVFGRAKTDTATESTKSRPNK